MHVRDVGRRQIRDTRVHSALFLNLAVHPIPDPRSVIHQTSPKAGAYPRVPRQGRTGLWDSLADLLCLRDVVCFFCWGWRNAGPASAVPAAGPSRACSGPGVDDDVCSEHTRLGADSHGGNGAAAEDDEQQRCGALLKVARALRCPALTYQTVVPGVGKGTRKGVVRACESIMRVQVSRAAARPRSPKDVCVQAVTLRNAAGMPPCRERRWRARQWSFTSKPSHW
eukprot:2250145-Rhodomonas_salina.2